MNEKKSEIIYTDGESMMAAQFDIENGGETGVLNALGALATSLSTSDFADALTYTPEYRAIRDELNATPRTKFKQHRELSKRIKAMMKNGGHYRRPDDDVAFGVEILDINTPSAED